MYNQEQQEILYIKRENLPSLQNTFYASLYINEYSIIPVINN